MSQFSNLGAEVGSEVEAGEGVMGHEEVKADVVLRDLT